MSTPTFFRNVLVGLIISTIASVTYTALSMIFDHDQALRWVINGTGLVYLAHLMALSTESVGRVTIIALFTILFGLMIVIAPTLIWTLSINLAFIWLTRSLYFHRNLTSALADLVLCLVSLSFAVWAAASTGSFFLTCWCFFLVQALWSSSPADVLNAENQDRGASATLLDERFQQAYRAAENAIRILTSNH